LVHWFVAALRLQILKRRHHVVLEFANFEEDEMRKIWIASATLASLSVIGCSDTMNSNMMSTNNNNSAAVNSNMATSSPARSLALTSGDREFLKEAAAGGIAEVEMGRLASQKAQNADVKRFGERMVTDHSKENAELKQVAASKDVTVPAEPNAEQKEEMDKLSKLSGAAFDREYMRMMVEDHDKDVKAFQDQANGTGDADVKSFASKTLPTLQEHQKMAHDIAAKLK